MGLRKDHEQLSRMIEANTHYVFREVNDLWKSHNDLFDRIAALKKALDSCAKTIDQHDHSEFAKLCEQIEALETQVQCGISGHKFKLVGIINDTEGEFVCEYCDVMYNRELTADELRSAKKLGFIDE